MAKLPASMVASNWYNSLTEEAESGGIHGGKDPEVSHHSYLKFNRFS